MNFNTGYSDLIELTLLPIGVFQGEEVDGKPQQNKNDLVLSTFPGNEALSAFTTKTPAPMGDGERFGRTPALHVGPVPSRASSVVSDASTTMPGGREGRREGREEVETSIVGKTREGGRRIPGTTGECFASKSPSNLPLSVSSSAGVSFMASPSSLANPSSIPRAVAPSLSSSFSSLTAKATRKTVNGQGDENEGGGGRRYPCFPVYRVKEEVPVCIKASCRIRQPQTGSEVTGGAEGLQVAVENRIPSPPGAGGSTVGGLSLFLATPVPVSSYPILPSGRNPIPAGKKEEVNEERRRDGGRRNGPLDPYAMQGPVCCKVLPGTRHIPLPDLMGYAVGSCMAEMAYRKPLSHCIERSAQEVLHYPGPSTFYSAKGERAWRHAPSSPPHAVTTPLGYTLRQDGRRQYLVFPVEDGKYALSLVVAPFVTRWMGEAAVAWITAMGIRGYPIALFQVMEKWQVVHDKEEDMEENGDGNVWKGRSGEERGGERLADADGAGDQKERGCPTSCWFHHPHRLPLYMPLHLRLQQTLQTESQGIPRPPPTYTSFAARPELAPFSLSATISRTAGEGRRETSEEERREMNRKQAMEPGWPWDPRGVECFCKSLPSTLYEQLQRLHDFMKGYVLSQMAPVSSPEEHQKSSTDKAIKKKNKEAEAARQHQHKRRARWWAAKAKELHRVCTERSSRMRYSSRVMRGIENALQTALMESSTRGNMVIPVGDTTLGAPMQGDTCHATTPLHHLPPPPPSFHLTGYALWFRGEPLLSMGSSTTLEEVLVPAAISATLHFRPHISCGGAPSLSSGAAAVSSTTASNALGAKEEQEILLDEDDLYHDTLDKAEQLQVQCTAMYSSRRAALLSTAFSSIRSSHSVRERTVSMFGAQLPLLRPEEIEWNAPGLIAVTCRTGQGWLLAMELEPSGTSSDPLRAGAGGILLSEVVSNAQRFLSGPLSGFDLLSSLAESSVRNLLRRPVSLYSASCVPLLHFVRACRIYYYHPSMAGSTSSSCYGVSLAPPPRRSGSAVPDSAPEVISGDGLPLLHLLFEFTCPRLSHHEERKRVEKIKKTRKEMESHRSTITEHKSPAGVYEPKSATMATATYPFPTSLASSSKDYQKELAKKRKECVVTIQPNPMVQLCLQERIETPISHSSGEGGRELSTEKEHRRPKRVTPPRKFIEHWNDGDKKMVAVAASLKVPERATSTTRTANTRSSRAASHGADFPFISSASTRDRGVGEGSELVYWDRIQSLVRVTAQLGTKRYRATARRTITRGAGKTNHKRESRDEKAHGTGTTMKHVSSSASSACALPCASSEGLKWAFVFSLISQESEECHSHHSSALRSDVIFHGVSTAVCRGSTNRIDNRRYPPRNSGGVLFVVIELKSKEEQKHLLFLPEHKRHGCVMDTREFAALSEWLLSKVM